MWAKQNLVRRIYSTFQAPPRRYRFPKIQTEALIAAEKEVKCPCCCIYRRCLSFYILPFSAISTATSKVLAYKVASSRCNKCTNFQKKDDDDMLSDAEIQDWHAHKMQCPAECANIHLEKAVALDIIERAHFSYIGC